MLKRMCEVVSSALRRRTDIRPVNAELAAFALVHAAFAVIQGALADRPELLDDDALGEVLADICVRYLAPG